MADANKDEVDKCKKVAENALAAGDADKAIRFLTKAKRMAPDDSSVDVLMERAQEVAASGGGSSEAAGGGERSAPPPQQEVPRYRTSTAGSTTSGRATPSSSGAQRTNKDGSTYTTEQMQLVQKILRAKDYYRILDLDNDAREDDIKKAYKKIALKLHPDKNKAPGAEEAFKKVSRAVQCLTDEEKRHAYDRYGDEDQIPQNQRGHHQDFMTPEDLFAAFFGGGGHVFHQHHQQRHHHHQHQDDGNPQVQRAQLFQMLPVLLLVLLTLASNFGSRDTPRFSFTLNGQYRNERSSAALNVDYFVTDDFEEHYSEGTRALAEFERNVEIYYVRNLHSECDYQEKVMHKKVMLAKRRGSVEELKQAKNHPRPACKQIEKIKKKNSAIYRSAMYMGG